MLLNNFEGNASYSSSYPPGDAGATKSTHLTNSITTTITTSSTQRVNTVEGSANTVDTWLHGSACFALAAYTIRAC